MILRKEFYFVRHGQTDHNVLEKRHKLDPSEDVPLNETGRNQARLIEPVISSLPIRTVCSSPLKRAQETKEIITSRLEASHHDIHDLSECSAYIWREMTQFGIYSALAPDSVVRQFMDRVRNGINQTLSLPGPSLIVAHGGIHWALCCLMNIEEHTWIINNCIPVHFSVEKHGKWIARVLT